MAFKYEKATTPSGGPQPGAVLLYKFILDSPYWGDQGGAKGLGIYNNRSIRNGKSLSIHAEGRALDIGYPPKSLYGDALFKILVDQHMKLGVQQILWSDKGWRIDRGSFDLSKKVADLHRDHLHIELTNKAAKGLKVHMIEQAFGERYPVGNTILTVGDQGLSVHEAQTRIKAHNIEIVVDGDFGPKTEIAVKKFQHSYGLTPDGIIGPKTWEALAKAPKPAAVKEVPGQEDPTKVFIPPSISQEIKKVPDVEEEKPLKPPQPPVRPSTEEMKIITPPKPKTIDLPESNEFSDGKIKYKSNEDNFLLLFEEILKALENFRKREI